MVGGVGGVGAVTRRGLLVALALLATGAPACSGSSDGASTGSTASDGTVAPVGAAEGIGDDTFPSLGSDDIDVSHYDLDLTWDPGAGALTAEVAIDLTTRGVLEVVELDFGELTVDGVRLAVGGGAPTEAEFEQGAGKLVIDAADPIPEATPVVVEVTYSGNPAPVTSVAPIPIGWVRTDDDGVATPSEPDAAHTWFPCNDHPTDKATYRTTVHAPEGLTSVANGVREATATEGGTTTSTWVMDAPMATYLALVAIDSFDEQDDGTAAGVPLRNYVPAGQGGNFAGGLGSQPTMVEYMVDRLGPYPFAEYGAVIVTGGNTALETQGRSLFFGPSARDRATVMHELSHQWIGDSVSVTSWRRDIWWVEGFGRFSEWLWAERSEGPGGYAGRAELAYQGLQFDERLAIGEVAPEQLFDSRVYEGGALVFYALRAELGDEQFFAAMRLFAERFRHGNATTDDLFAVFAEVAGRDVRPVAEPFLTAGPLPPLEF